MNIQEIKDPRFLKDLSFSEMKQLAKDIRHFLIDQVSKTGGHLSSNLGIVELTIALHAVFNSPVDKIIFDVGHQSYVHKILTGRSSLFKTLRQLNGLSGYQNRQESQHDFWEAGHAGTSLSAALGMAISRDLNHQEHHVVVVIGDGSISNGISFEALNHIGAEKRKLIIVLNDNEMSISKNVGAFSHSIAKMRSSAPYTSFKHELKDVLEKTSVGKTVLVGMKGIKDTIKRSVISPSIFTDLNLEYIGPINGHSLHELADAFHSAKVHDRPILIHVRTQKGKGFSLSEKDTNGSWHGVSQFDPDSGAMISNLPAGFLSWSQILSESLIRLMKEDEKIVAITPAMIQGSKLEKAFALFPDRCFDTGIAESHATIMAAGLAQSGHKPFLSIYSSFLQRSYDQVNHDIARMNLPVVVGIDRAGLVGEDGATHHGVFDIGFLRSIPNIILSAPKDALEAQNLLYTAFKSQKPFFIRYPRGNAAFVEASSLELLELGKWTSLGNFDQASAYIISYGPDVDKLQQRLTVNDLNVCVINARFIKPLDEHMIRDLSQRNKPVLCYETDQLASGLGSAILEFLEHEHLSLNLRRVGIEDHFVTHGTLTDLRLQERIDVNHVLDLIESWLKS